MTNLLCHHISCTKLYCGKSISKDVRDPQNSYFLHFQMPSPSSVADEVWFAPPPPLPFVWQVCVPVCSQLFLPFLLPLAVSKPALKQLISKEQTLSSHFLLQSNLQWFSFDIQSAPRQPLQDVEWHKSQAPFCRLRPWAYLINPQVRNASPSCGPSAGSCLSLPQDWGWLQACQHPAQWYKRFCLNKSFFLSSSMWRQTREDRRVSITIISFKKWLCTIRKTPSCWLRQTLAMQSQVLPNLALSELSLGSSILHPGTDQCEKDRSGQLTPYSLKPILSLIN